MVAFLEQDLAAWPHISCAVRIGPTGMVEGDFTGWLWGVGKLGQDEVAAAYEEWANFFEYRLTQQTDLLGQDRTAHLLLERWTEGMAYVCRRLAAFARGEFPGEWIPQHERRPDLMPGVGGSDHGG